MDDETKEALEKSIEKWQANVEAEKWDEVLMSRADCPLCVLYNNGSSVLDTDCKGCPILEKTGARYCSGSPFSKVFGLQQIEDPEQEGHLVSDEAREAMKAEVEFLKGLLGEQK